MSMVQHNDQSVLVTLVPLMLALICFFLCWGHILYIVRGLYLCNYAPNRPGGTKTVHIQAELLWSEAGQNYKTEREWRPTSLFFMHIDTDTHYMIIQLVKKSNILLFFSQIESKQFDAIATGADV